MTPSCPTARGCLDEVARGCAAGRAPRAVVARGDREHPDVVASRLHFLVVVVADFARRLFDRIRGAAVELDQLEGLDLLRFAVLGDLEVALLQVRDGIAFIVGDDDVDADKVDPGPEDGRRLGGIRRCGDAVGGCCAWERGRPCLGREAGGPAERMCDPTCILI